MYTQRGRLRGSRFQKEKFILHHQPLNHTKTILIRYLAWFLSRRLVVRAEFQSWRRGRRALPVYGVQCRRLGMIGIVFPPSRHPTSQNDSARGRNGGSSVCAQELRAYTSTSDPICAAPGFRERNGETEGEEGGGSRNPRWRHRASVQLCPHLGPVAPIPSATTNPVRLDLHPGTRQLLPHLLCPPLRLLILPVCS